MTQETLPILPYPDRRAGRSSGWSGSDTSRERAERDDATGVTSERQRFVLSLLGNRGPAGLTWHELAESTGMHHGQASGVLSNLHQGGRVARLSDRRGRCHPYVLPEYVQGRETQPYGGKRPSTPAPATSLSPEAIAWERGLVEGLRDDDTPIADNPYSS